MKIEKSGQHKKKSWKKGTPTAKVSIDRACVSGIFLLFAILMITGLPQTANSAVLWSDDFESGGANWHADNGTWEVGTPTIGPLTAHSPTKCAATVLAGNYADNVTTRFIRHVSFTVPSADQNPRLRFWNWFSFSSSYGTDFGKVQIKVDGETTWTDISGQYTNTSSNAWSKASIDLSAWAGQSVQVAFYFQSTTNHYNGAQFTSSGWYIDDVEVVTGPIVFSNPESFEFGLGDWSAESGTWEVGTPMSGPGTAYNGSQCAGTRLAGNYDDHAISRLISPVFAVPSANDNPRLRFWNWFSFSSSYGTDFGKVQIKVDGETTWTDISGQYTNTSSNAWSKASIDLSAWAGQSVQVAFYFQSTTNHYNGTQFTSSGWYIDDVEVVTGPIVFSKPEDFESGLDDWSAESGTWEVGTPTSGPGGAYNGIQCAGTRLAGNYDDHDVSRLVSPMFLVPAVNDNPRLRFWNWFSFSSSYGTDFGKVQIKAYGETTWTDISGQYTNTSSNAWSKASIDLSAWAGQSVQVAFYFQSTTNHYNGAQFTSSGWYIDDVEVVTGPIVFSNPESFEFGLGDWSAESGTWEVGTPSSGPGAAYNGSQCAGTRLAGNYDDHAISRLISPVFVVPPASVNPALRFWNWYSFSNSYGTDFGKVQIKAEGETDWTDISGQYTNTSSGVWSYMYIALSDYAGQSVQVAFYFQSTTNHYNGTQYTSSGWYIDDVTIEPIIQQTGSLIVTITPQAAITAGAQWRVDSGTWQNSGATVSNLTVGTHTVNFKAITGWTAPADQVVSITSGQTTTATGKYAQHRSLTVNINPTAAITAGAQWRVDAGAWQNSGATVSNLTVGTHIVDYKAITGWTAPADQTVTIVSDQAAAKTGTYTQQPVLSVSPSIQNVAKEAGTTTFSVSNIGTGTIAWTAAESPSVGWLSITPTSGTNSGTISCTFTANTGTAPRTATIRVTATGAIGSPKDVTVTQAESPPPAGFFSRYVQAFYIPGVKMTVTLSAKPSPGISNYAVEDLPPAGWTVSNLSAGGVYDAARHKVKFGAFFDSNPRTFTYDITPPVGASGVQTFNGTGSIDGTNYPVGGVSQVNLGTYHPADRNTADFNIVIAEYTAYGAAWKTGTAWPVPPNPIPISYVTKAGQLWTLGESYVYDSSAGVPPLCWVNDSNSPVQSFSYASSSLSTAVCGMPKGYQPGKTFTVSITVTPLSEVASYAVEDLFPVGWTVSNVSDSGGFDAVANKVKFGPFSDNSPRVLTYDVTPPANASGVYTFTGVASFDGVDIAISGVREIKEAPPVIVGPMLQLLLSD